MQIIADRGRHDACRTIGRRGHDTAAGGIFLVHRHRVDAQPVIGEQRIDLVGAPLILQLVMDHAGAAANLEATRQNAVLGKAAIDTALHRRPDAVKAGIQFFSGHGTFLVRPFHLGNRKTRTRRHFKHLFGGPEGIGNLDAVWLVLARLHRFKLGVGHHETAADRIIDALQDKPAVAVEGGEGHAVGMAGQRHLLVEDEIGLRLEIIGRMAGRRDPAGALDLFNDRIHEIGIDAVRALAHQPEDDGAARAMADAGIGQRTMQADLDRRDMGIGRSRPIARQNEIEEAHGGRHRPHGVRTGGADPDLEDIKNRKKHSNSALGLDGACGAPKSSVKKA